MDKKLDAQETSAVPYLGYLDKEMTIMGILSSFCVLSVGALFSSLASDKAGELFTKAWSNHADLLILGSGLVLLAAFGFYWQRSRLACFYGQICLTLQTPNLAEQDRSVEDWLKKGDSYSAWFRYDFAFIFLMVGALDCFGALTDEPRRLRHSLRLAFGILVLALVASCLRLLILRHFDWEDDAWSRFWKMPAKKKIEIIWRR